MIAYHVKFDDFFAIFFRYHHQPYKCPNATATGSGNTAAAAPNPALFRVRLSVGNIEVMGEGKDASQEFSGNVSFYSLGKSGPKLLIFPQTYKNIFDPLEILQLFHV